MPFRLTLDTIMTDIRQRFYFTDGPVRGEIVQLETTLADTCRRHDYPDTVKRLLGELLAAAVMLTATLKLEGRLSLLARGNGRLRVLMAECTHTHDVRAIAQLEESDLPFPADSSLRELLGNGTLAITLEPERGVEEITVLGWLK